MHEGKPLDTSFNQQALAYGGKVSEKLTNNVTHLIWSDGRIKTVNKAQEMNIKIVSPLWFERCLNELELADESKFLPTVIRDKQDKFNIKSMKSLKDQLQVTNEQKKRSLNNAQQSKLIEYRSSEKESS